MKKIISLNNSNSHYQKRLARSFKTLSRKALRCYKQQGETQQGIELIQKEVLKFTHNKIDLPYLIQMLRSFIQDVKAEDQHYVCRLIDTKQIQVALHLAPADTVFPAHTHPDSLNIVLLVAGSLQVEQFSDQGSHKRTLLEEYGCSVGLKHLYNKHALQATQSVNVFFSIRCKTQSCLRQNTLNTLFSYGLSALLLPAYACSDFDSEGSSIISGIEIEQDNGAEIVEIANQIRSQTDDDEVLYKAVNFYFKAAAKQNPEAQYWLGVMHLKGMGITEDSDEALRWVSASSDQDYPPAKALLQFILTHDEALDC